MNDSSSNVNSSFESEVERNPVNDNISIDKKSSIKTESQKKSVDKSEGEKSPKKKNDQFNSQKDVNTKPENMLIFNDTENSKDKNSIKNHQPSEKSQKNKESIPVRHNITINTIINNQINYITDSKVNNPFHLNLENMLSQQDKFATFMRSIFKQILSSNSMDQNYEKIHEIIKGNEHKYVDFLFPSNHINSLLKGYKHKNQKNSNKKNNKFDFYKEYKKIKWWRESDANDFASIFPRDDRLINQIVTENASNPNFLSVINAISVFPGRIKKLFVDDKKDYSAIFAVKICKNGFCQEVVIDDYFPVWKNNESLVFSSEKRGYLWVQILEKAYAKIYGSYYLISEKKTENILKDFLYAPVKTYEKSNDTKIKDIIFDALKNGWIIMAGAGDTEASENLLEDIGLKSNADYEIVYVYQLTDEDIQNIEEKSLFVPKNDDYKIVLKIRNIWKKIKWIGDWSEYSTGLWTEHFKKELKKNDADLCFYMNLIDFKNIFSKVKICKYNRNFLYSSVLIKQLPEEYCLISLKVKNKEGINANKAYISFIQEDKSNIDNNFKFNLGRFILCRNENGEFFYEKGIMGKEREIIMETILMQNSEYIIFAQIENIKKATEYVISVYYDIQVEMKEINISKYPNFLEKVYIELAKRNNDKYDKLDENLECGKILDNTQEGYSYIFIENHEDDTTFIEDVKYTKFEGLKLLPPFSGTGYHIEVGPGEEKIILIKHLEINEYKLIFSYQSNFLFGKNTLIKLTKNSKFCKKRIDKKTKQEVDILVYTFKHSFGLCFFYENNTDNKRLKEKINISNNTNIQFVGRPEGTTEIIIKLEPHQTQFVQLKSKNALWKVQPVISYNVYDLTKDDKEKEK